MGILKHIFKNGRKVAYFFLILLAFFPILPFGIISIVLVFFSLFSVVFFWQEGKDNLKNLGLGPALYNSGFYLLLCLTLLYSDDFYQGLKTLQAGVSILILPVIIIYFQPKYSEKERNFIYLAFVLANLLYVIFLFEYLVVNVTENCYPELKELSLFQKYYYSNDVSFDFLLWCSESVAKTKLFIHKTYISISFLFAGILILQLIYKGNVPNYVKIFLVVPLIIFTFLIIYLHSMMNMGLIIIFIIVFILNKIRKRILFKMLFISFIFFLGVFIFNLILKNTKQNIEEIQTQFKIFKNEKKYDGILEREMLNQCNAAILRNNWLFGIGIGDVQTKLNECYYNKIDENHYYQKAFLNKVNSHNYFYLLIQSGGVFVLLSFLILLFLNIRLSINQKHYPYLLFLVIIILNLTIENVLSRMYGVIFYSFFNSLFFAELMAQKRSINGNQ